jgi:hypothetical protein
MEMEGDMSTAEERMQSAIEELEQENRLLRARNDRLEAEANAAPVQEPIIDHSCKDTYELIMKWADIYAAQTGELYSQAAQDPSKVARMADERTMLACVVAQAFQSPAAQRQWVGLTDDDIEEMWGESVSLMYSGYYDSIRAIEAKLKEKNS